MPEARIILMYHRVAAPNGDPLDLCVDPARFEEHLRLLRSLGDVVPLGELRGGGRRPRFAVTFDDGYADNALAAAPVLASLDVPATVFVVGGVVDDPRPFWWDRLVALLLERPLPPTVELPVGPRPVAVDTRSAEGRMRAYWAAWSRLRLQPAERIEEALAALAEILGDASPPPEARPMTAAELESLEAHGIEVGAHTLTHPSLPALGPKAQRREIEGGRTRLEQLLGRPVDLFAYPYGDYDASAVRAVRRAGFRAACSVQVGAVSALSSRLLLPRFGVKDWSVEELERRIAPP